MHAWELCRTLVFRVNPSVNVRSAVTSSCTTSRTTPPVGHPMHGCKLQHCRHRQRRPRAPGAVSPNRVYVSVKSRVLHFFRQDHSDNDDATTIAYAYLIFRSMLENLSMALESRRFDALSDSEMPQIKNALSPPDADGR